MRVVVVGGGVAGSASAIALARIGAQVTVYEAYENPAGPVGSFVSLSVNGLRALDASDAWRRFNGRASRWTGSVCGPGGTGRWATYLAGDGPAIRSTA